MFPSKTIVGPVVFVATLLGGSGLSVPHRMRTVSEQISGNQFVEAGPMVIVVKAAIGPQPQVPSVPDQRDSQNAALQSKLDDAIKQLEASEREKALLSEKLEVSRERKSGPKTKMHPPRGGNPGIHGNVLAVNRAYNFVILNLGEVQGVESNSEMLVLRRNSYIGKIHISSVEPTMAIGDIITNSLERGLQVRIGDTVIYAGTNP